MTAVGPFRRSGMAAALAAAALGVCACGSSSDDGPSYCEARDDLQQAIGDLKEVDVTAQGTNQLKAQLDEVVSKAEAVAASTKTDFPDQSGDVQSSVGQLKQAIDAVDCTPSAQQVAQIAGYLGAAATSVESLGKATKDACS
jgi:hypothetical protein